jgi:chromosome partitioning protein
MNITIANRKGGTGKTVTAYNLAFTYALQGQRVCLVDLDSQANLTLLCGKEPVSLEAFKGASAVEVNRNVDILPATKRFAMLESEIQQLLDRNTYLRTEILPKLQGYDYVIIDTPPALSILNVNAFCVSDRVFIVMNADYFSLSAIQEMREILDQIKEINPRLEYSLILNAFFKNRTLTESMVNVLVGEPSFSGISIPYRQHIQNCVALRKPAIDSEEIHAPFLQLAALGGNHEKE